MFNLMKKFLILLLLFFMNIGSSYAGFESWFEATKYCTKIYNLKDDSQINSTLLILEALASQGESKASACLGRLYDGASIIKRDSPKSFNWHLKAAEQGDPYAPRVLGFKYQTGDGVQRDYDKALFWYKKGAELGDLLAINKLVIMYEFGVGGVLKNIDEALFWTKLAVNHGQDQYIEKLKKLDLMVKIQNDQIASSKKSIKLQTDNSYQEVLSKHQLLILESLQLESDIDLSIYQMGLLKDSWETREAFARDELKQLNLSLVNNDRLLPLAQKQNNKLNDQLSFSRKTNEQLKQDVLAFNLELKSLHESEEKQIESHMDTLKSIYLDSIIASVKSNWNHFGTKDKWSCDIKLTQKRNGVVKEVFIDNCIVDKAYKETLFKNSISRAIYKSSPLPSKPSGLNFNEEISFNFSVN